MVARTARRAVFACDSVRSMAGVGSRALALLTVALGAACATHRGVRPSLVVAAPAQPATRPVYRYVSFGVTNALAQQQLEAGRIGVIADNGVAREVVAPDGSIERAAGPSGDRLMGGVPVPARLGGGFLFWGSALYRARSFAGPLEAITDIPTNVLGVEFGPDYALILLPGSPPRAFAFDPPRMTRQSPHGVVDVAATDDGRAVALDATGRALVSTDAGKSWKDVTRAVGGVQGVRNEGPDVGFVSRQPLGAWLQKDGSLVQRPIAPAPGPSPEQKAAALLEQAFVGGLPLPGPGANALVGEKTGLRVVDLQAGAADPATHVGPDGSRCTPVSLDDEGVAVCIDYGSQSTTTVVSHALSEAPRVEKTFQGPLGFAHDGALILFGSCSEPPAEGAVCIRRSDGTFVDVSVPAELLDAWQPQFWVLRPDGGVVVIARARDSGKVALIEPAKGTVTPWDLGADRVMSGDRRGASFRVLADGTVRGFTSTGSLSVDAKGHVTLGSRTFASIVSAGAHALARDDAEHLWQTNDYGATWREVARPPFDASPEGVGAKVDPRPSGRSTRIQCSLVGCAFEHPSGTGYWLRIGWPEDPPHQAGSAVASAPSAAPAPPPSAAPPPLSPRELPKLRCVTRSGGPLRAPPFVPRAVAPLSVPKASAPRAAAPRAAAWKPSSQSTAIFGGKRPLTGPTTNLAFRDVYSGQETFVHYGLRAVVTIASPAGEPLQSLIDRHVNSELLFTEPFEPSGRTRQSLGSLRGWQPQKTAGTPGSLSSARRSPALDEPEGLVRPVLSIAPGHVAGQLLNDGAFAYWAASGGALRALRPGCSASSGYADPSGMLFVACAERSGATQVEEAASGAVLLRLPVATPFRDQNNPGLHFFPPGKPLLVNPDAIAVAGDGKPRILRLPPGDEPPTTDNPAWILSSDAAPVELAPWSTLELASSPECAHQDGYRAIVQSGQSWLSIDGASGFRPQNGMTALVRWSADRVCLEAVEVGFSELAQGDSRAIRVSAVARFVGSEPGAAFVGTESASAVREPALCELEGVAPAKP